MKVNFSFQQTLQTAHPSKEIEIVFAGEALVTGNEDVQICRVFADKNMGGIPLEIPKGYEAQNLASGEMGNFLGKCREAARNAYYKERMKEAATRHSNILLQGAPNKGFLPVSNDTRYMNDDSDMNFPPQPDRIQ